MENKKLTIKLLSNLGFKFNEYKDTAWITTTDKETTDDYYEKRQFVITKENKKWWLTLGDYRVGLSVELKDLNDLKKHFL